MTISTYLGNKLLDHIAGSSYTPPASLWASLHSGDPGLTGASEISGASYVRQQLYFTASAVAKNLVTTSSLNFAGMPAASIRYFGAWDASANGNFLLGGAATASTLTASGQLFQVLAGDFTMSVT